MMALGGVLKLLRICCIPDSGGCVATARAPGLPENVDGLDGILLAPSVPFLSHYLGFRRKLIRWLTPASQRRTSWDITGQSHEPFSGANPPATLTLDRRLTVFAIDRRSSSPTAVLHQLSEVGTSSRPKRESSPGLVSWLLRRHFYSDTSCLPPN